MRFFKKSGDSNSRRRIGCLLIIALSLAFSSNTAAQNDVAGRWSRLPDLPSDFRHVHLLPNGKVMMWANQQSDARLWDPATATTTSLAPLGYIPFCGGHAFLADGSLFVAGGHIESSVGVPNASAYDPFRDIWTSVPNMNAGRWYPTVTTLANGDMLVVSGNIDNTVGENLLPQIYQPGNNTWRDLTNAQLRLDLYPRMHLAPVPEVSR